MTYNALKSIDLTNFVNVFMCFLVSCSNSGGQVSPVWTMAFCRILLSFSSCLQFKIMWLIVCSSFILQGHVELGINLNLWRYNHRFKLCVCVCDWERGERERESAHVHACMKILMQGFIQGVMWTKFNCFIL